MPLSTNETTNETGRKLIETLKGAFHTPNGFRPAHARGILLKGNFTPTSEAASLSKAHHFNNSVPVTVRFSNSTGIPVIPDNDPNASPRGMAVRFNLPYTTDGKRVHTDIVAHSSKFFPVRTGEGFLGLLQAIGGGTIGDFLQQNPSAAAFVNDPKPNPVSFATLSYYALNAFKFTSADGKTTTVRYRWIPVAGDQFISEEDAKTRDPAYLHNEVQTRVIDEGISFKLLVQVAEDGDPTNDVTVHWPEDRKTVELGTMKLDGVLENNDEEQRKIIFDPIPRTDGIQETDDPLFEVRASLYLQSGKDRRSHPYEK